MLQHETKHNKFRPNKYVHDRERKFFGELGEEAMNSSYFNMIFSALLGTAFVVMSISILSDGLFHTETPEKEGFAIAALEAGAGGEPGGTEDVLPPISPLLASADVAAGEKVFKKCASCHTAEEGGANKVGPALYNVVNRQAGSVDGFGYSAAMTEFAAGDAGNWDYENLNKFLLKPKAFIKGTGMGFAGLKKEKDRANLIAYMRTLSGSPAPLPEAGAETTTAEQPATE